MAALCLAGFAFAWWARLHLGRLWSGFVTRKADHRIIDSGPYRIVRHPIYTGIIVAAIAMAIAKGTIYAVAGALLAILSFWVKARLEEKFLREQLGPETYDAYRRRVPMLIPFAPA
jgi:protein-S-isoprenylcysteine O-methyltransferase Ste14